MPYTVSGDAEGCGGFAVVKEGTNTPIPGGCHSSKAAAIAHMVAVQAGYEGDERQLEDGSPNGEEEGGEEEANLAPRQQAMYEVYEAIAEQFGPWGQGVGADGAHYVAESPFADGGMVCANCAFYEGGQRCEIVSGQIAPLGICKLWVIEERLLSVEPEEEPMEYESREQPRDGLGRWASSSGAGGTAMSAATPGEAQKIENKLLDRQEEAEAELPIGVKQEVYRYTDSGYKELNRGLRGAPPPPPSPGEQSQANRQAQKIEEAIDSMPPLSQNLVVHRSASPEALGLSGQDALSNIKIGSTVMDKGILSTSIDPEIGQTFNVRGSIRMEIRIPAGNKVLLVKNMSAHSGEREVLLGRNTKMKVVGTREDTVILEVG